MVEKLKKDGPTSGAEQSLIAELNISASFILSHVSLNDRDFEQVEKALSAQKFAPTKYASLATAFFETFKERSQLDISTAPLAWQRASKGDFDGFDFSSHSKIIDWALSIRTESFDLAGQIEFYEKKFKWLIEVQNAGRALVAFSQGKTAEEYLMICETNRETSGAYFEVATEKNWKDEYQTVLDDQFAGKEVRLIKSPFRAMDSYRKAMKPGQLGIVGGRPGAGKTAYMLSAAEKFSENGEIVAMASLEMSVDEIAERYLSKFLGFTLGDESIMNLSEENQRMLKLYWNQIKNSLQLHVADNVFTISEIERYAIYMKRKHRVSVLIVDYLQLIQSDPGVRNQNREQEVSSFSRRLKILAKKLQILIIAGAQLSRAVETRGGTKRPQLSDLRESGGVEQDADWVDFLYRPEYYGITEDEQGNSLLGAAEVITAKHRRGKTGVAKLRFGGLEMFYEQTNSADRRGWNMTNEPLLETPPTDVIDEGQQVITRPSKTKDEDTPF